MTTTERTSGRIHRINISEGGVPKRPVPTAQIVESGVVGDLHADRRHHGGPHQALCIWSLEVIDALRDEGHPIEPGFAGENITVTGIDWSLVLPGVVLHLGSEVVAPITYDTTPCSKNAAWFLDRDFRRMSHELHPGWSRMYAAVTRPGTVSVGDPVRIVGA